MYFVLAVANLMVDESIAEIEAASCVDFIDANSVDIGSLRLGHTRTIDIRDRDNG